VKQILSPYKSALVILLMAPLGAVLMGWFEGKVRTWSDLPAILDHGCFLAVMMTIAWLFFRSPLAKQYTALVKETEESAGSFMSPATLKSKTTILTGDAPISPEAIAKVNDAASSESKLS